jgi:hypothetical protein
VCLFFCSIFCFFFVFVCWSHFDIDVTQLSAIEKVTISADDFYWRSAFKLSSAPSFKGLGTASPPKFACGNLQWSINMHDYEY